MKLMITYIENEIILNPEYVYSIEIENRNYFYRLVNEFNQIANGEISNNISLFDKDNNEINLTNKIIVLMDYFNLDFKKYSSFIQNLVINNIEENDRDKIALEYKKMVNLLKKTLNGLDIPILIEKEFDLPTIIKTLKLNIEGKSGIFDNLLLLLDIEKSLNVNKILIFVNLKQYLSEEELIEIYKYAIYNNITIITIDSQTYKQVKYEEKIIIDNNLDEIMIK